MNNSKKIWIALGTLILVVALLVGVYFVTRPQPQEGAKTISVVVVHKDKSEETFTYHTDEMYLAPVLVAEGLIEQDNIVSGFFDTVKGEKADYNADQGWWAVYEGDEMAQVGITELAIEDGDTFRLVYTIGFAS